MIALTWAAVVPSGVHGPEPITDTSSVQVVSGFIGDDTKTCDLVKQGLPLVTANLPG